MVKRSIYIIAVILFVSFVPIKTIAQQPSVYEVKRMSFNTDGFSEISPVLVKDGIIFCSDRRFSVFKDRTAWDGRRLYNIYMAARKDSSAWRTPKELKSERSSLFNNGPLCFAPDGKTVYFTSEIETGKAAKKRNFINHSGIFIADLSGTDLLSLRPFKYNNLQYDVGQPSISSDGKYLFFASDMPGGQGGSDLYYCELINGEWSVPVNLGNKVNSPGVENFPYMHPSGKLYFTSNRTGGVGKLDVYFTTLNYGTWEDPVLLPEPINSTSDDFAFVAGDNLQTGYFSSNRRRSDDIYEFASTIIRKASCDTLVENSYCYRFLEENAVKFDTMPFRYEWKFGDGNKAIGAMVEHCYKGPGTYLVQLDVVNLITKEVLYNEKSDTLVLTEIEQPYISGPDRANTGQRIMLNADSTNLPGWKIASYYWNFGDETIAIGKEVDKSYMKPGTYNIQLIVSTEPEPGGMIREACISKNIIVLRQP
jgi:Tol biopolymer transport system component